MASDTVSATLIGTLASTLAAAATWVLTGRRKDRAEGDGFLADAAQAIVASAMSLVTAQETEVHDCQKALAEVRAELAAVRARLAALEG